MNLKKIKFRVGIERVDIGDGGLLKAGPEGSTPLIFHSFGPASVSKEINDTNTL
jgi:hypothetical protein